MKHQTTDSTACTRHVTTGKRNHCVHEAITQHSQVTVHTGAAPHPFTTTVSEQLIFDEYIK